MALDDAGRCGPLFDHQRCTGHTSGAKKAEWCNEGTGSCGTSAAHKSVGANSAYSYAPTYSIHMTGTTYQSGMYPYLLGGGSKNVQPSAQACMDQCLSLDECLYGTFVTQGGSVKKHKIDYAAQLVRYGECWLAAQTHDTPVSCGVACKGFVKVAAAEVAPTTAPPNIKQANECLCDSTATPDVYMRCMSTCKFHGLHTFQRSSCNCDPQADRSVFTMCKKDPFNSNIRVKHLVPRFHTVAFKGGEQHRCKMLDATKCACCDCRDNGSFYEIREIGFGIHTATAPFLTEQPVVVADYHACMDACNANHLCRAGTYITGGADVGECWISEHLESSMPCQKPCDSFIRVRESDATPEPTTAAPTQSCACGAVRAPVFCASTGETYNNQCLANCAKAEQCTAQ